MSAFLQFTAASNGRANRRDYEVYAFQHAYRYRAWEIEET
mgnify:CR=1 FL=1